MKTELEEYNSINKLEIFENFQYFLKLKKCVIDFRDTLYVQQNEIIWARLKLHRTNIKLLFDNIIYIVKQF